MSTEIITHITPRQSVYGFPSSGVLPTAFITIPIFGNSPLGSHIGLLPVFSNVAPSSTICTTTPTPRNPSGKSKASNRNRAYSTLVNNPAVASLLNPPNNAPNNSNNSKAVPRPPFFNDKLFKQNAQWSVKELCVLQACLKNESSNQKRLASL